MGNFLAADRRRMYTGAGLAAVVLGICRIWYSWQAGAVFAVLFLLAGALKIPGKHPGTALILNGIWGVGCIFLSALTPSALYGQNSFFALPRYFIALNMICVAVAYGICLGITGRIKPAVTAASGILLGISTANFFVCQFRGHEMTPMDFSYMSTAVTVMGQYVFRIEAPMAYSWMLWGWNVFAMGCLPSEKSIPWKWLLRLGALGAAVLCMGAFRIGAKNIKPLNWENEGSIYNGYYLNFSAQLRDSVIRPPEGYSEEKISELEKHWSDAGEPGHRPNVVAVMLESVGDLTVLGDELRTNVPVLPVLESLTENTIRGYALCPVFGGTTANSEFEFLTGQSTAFLPRGAVPYSQYMDENVYSLAWYLRSLGYEVETTHPFSSSGYDRKRVYPLLGFQKSTFEEAYPDAGRIRSYVSDQEVFDYILRQLDRPDPLFLFGVTMQNHGGYLYEGKNYEKSISLEGYSRDFPQAEQYLSLLHETDRAVGQFLKELEEYPEETIVLLFGDHLPDIEQEFYREIHGGPFEELQDKMRQYTVPFYIWANFDIPEEEVPCTSLNYLANYLLKAAGIELPPYQQFLADLEQVIPAQNFMGYYSKSRQQYLPMAEAEGEEAAWLAKYGLLQYNSLFDEKGRSEGFFGRYLPD